LTEKEVEVTKTRHDITTFKARIKASKPHFLQKVVSHRHTIEDALKPHFSTSVTMFYPKLKPTQQKPVTMISISNGAGSVLIRIANPHQLAEIFRMLADIVTSDEWIAKWETLEKIADGLQISDMGDYMDVFDFEKVKEKKLPTPEFTDQEETIDDYM